MKRFFLFLMLCVCGLSYSVNAQIEITIGNGDTNSGVLPIEDGFKYSVTQQIFTAEELLATEGNFTAVSFKMANASGATRSIAVYMVNTEKESFAHTQDWVNLSDANLVYSGPLTYPGESGEWVKIQFQNAFSYEGGNALLCVIDNTAVFENYEDESKFYTYSTGSTPRSLNKASLQYSYNPGSLSSVYGNYTGSNPYYNNQVIFDYEISDDVEPSVTVTPNPINLGHCPVGKWKAPYEVSVASNIAAMTINSITSSDSFFNLSDVDTPVDVVYGSPVTFEITAGTGTGNKSGQLTITYGDDNATEVVEMSAVAYTPTGNDVWEMAEVVSTYPSLLMPTMTNVYDNYVLPFGGEDGADVVYKLVFDTDQLLSVTPTGATGAKAVLYEEDFQGVGGPHIDNYYPLQESGIISDMLVPAGTYYLVASAPTTPLMIYIETEASPLASQATNPTPAYNAQNVTNSTLSWNFGANTVEYQVLFGTQNPPQDVVVNWTNNLQTQYNAGNLADNTTYFWQVNTRNSSGETEGDVWMFSTPFEAPAGVMASNTMLYEGDNVTISWPAVSNTMNIGYNVYADNVRLNDEVIAALSYSTNELPYNISGHNVTVTAAYPYGESAHTEFINVYVTGTTTVQGRLLEIDGNTSLTAGEVSFAGKDEYNVSHTYKIPVNSNGEYSAEILVGDYIVTATSAGYQTMSQEIELVYGEPMTLDFYMSENYQTVDNVVATELTNSVKVEWEMESRAFSSFNVYRTNIHSDVITPLVKNIEETSYTDNEWNSLEAGTYKWGVSAVYEGNRVEEILYKEDFESGSMPQGWTIYQEPQSEYYISDWAVKSSSYNTYAYDGSYSAFSQGSASSSSYYMVTSAFDLSLCSSVKLNFQYVTPAWDGDVNVLKVMVGNSQSGPWTEVWSTNGADVPTWTEANVDLSEYAQKDTYIAFVNENNYGYCVGIDNFKVINNSNESAIVWSNTIDKGMSTSVEVNVSTNSGDSAEGATVSFINMVETTDYIVVIDDSGSHKWNNFRKGKYELTVELPGFTSEYQSKVVEIWDAEEFDIVLQEVLAPVQNLYVSPTGWVKWDAADTRALESYTIKLNGATVDEVTTPYYQHDIEAYAFEDGTVYTTTVIANYTSGSSAAVKASWTFRECDDFEYASEIKVENVDGKNVLTWTMPEVSHENESAGNSIFYDDGYNVDGVGRYSGGTFYWGIKFTPEDLAPYVGKKILKVMTYDYAYHNGEFYIYTGGDTAPINKIYTQPYYCYGTKQYVEFEMTEAIPVGTEPIWIIFHNLNGQYIAPAGANTGNPNGRWISEDGEVWWDMYADIEWDYTWNIRAFLNYEGEYPGMENDIIGTMIYRDGELLVSEPVEGNTFTDETADADAEYCLKVVHGGLPNVSYYAMSCLACPEESVVENELEDLMVYPNPTKSNLNITAENMKRISIINTLGQIVYDAEVDSDNEVIDMAQYESGLYMVRIITENGVAVERVNVVK